MLVGGVKQQQAATQPKLSTVECAGLHANGDDCGGYGRRMFDE